MGIVRVGIDLSEVGQVADALVRFGDRYVQRIFTSQEISECAASSNSQAADLAVRFAAKEAVLKALGPEGDDFPGWTSIEVSGCSGGSMTVRLSGAARDLAAKAGIEAWLLSSVHDGRIASAMALGIGAGRKFQSKREMADTETGQKAKPWRPDE